MLKEWVCLRRHHETSSYTPETASIAPGILPIVARDQSDDADQRLLSSWSNSPTEPQTLRVWTSIVFVVLCTLKNNCRSSTGHFVSRSDMERDGPLWNASQIASYGFRSRASCLCCLLTFHTFFLPCFISSM